MGARHLCFNLRSNHLRMVSWNLRPMHFLSVFKVAQDLKPGGYKHFFLLHGKMIHFEYRSIFPTGLKLSLQMISWM